MTGFKPLYQLSHNHCPSTGNFLFKPHSHISGCYGVANAHGPYQSQQVVSNIQPLNSNRKFLSPLLAFPYFYLV